MTSESCIQPQNQLHSSHSLYFIHTCEPANLQITCKPDIDMVRVELNLTESGLAAALNTSLLYRALNYSVDRMIGNCKVLPEKLDLDARGYWRVTDKSARY